MFLLACYVLMSEKCSRCPEERFTLQMGKNKGLYIEKFRLTSFLYQFGDHNMDTNWVGIRNSMRMSKISFQKTTLFFKNHLTICSCKIKSHSNNKIRNHDMLHHTRCHIIAERGLNESTLGKKCVFCVEKFGSLPDLESHIITYHSNRVHNCIKGRLEVLYNKLVLSFGTKIGGANHCYCNCDNLISPKSPEIICRSCNRILISLNSQLGLALNPFKAINYIYCQGCNWFKAYCQLCCSFIKLTNSEYKKTHDCNGLNLSKLRNCHTISIHISHHLMAINCQHNRFSDTYRFETCTESRLTAEIELLNMKSEDLDFFYQR